MLLLSVRKENIKALYYVPLIKNIFFDWPLECGLFMGPIAIKRDKLNQLLTIRHGWVIFYIDDGCGR